MKEIRAVGGARILVDDDVFVSLNKFKWYFTDDGRRGVLRYLGHRRINMAKTILKLNPITHRYNMIRYLDGDMLNLQRSNLMVITRAANVQGRRPPNKASKYTGVVYVGNSAQFRNKKWRAVTFINNKRTNIGYFFTEDMAAVAYNLFVLKHIGKHAILNVVLGMERYYEPKEA